MRKLGKNGLIKETDKIFDMHKDVYVGNKCIPYCEIVKSMHREHYEKIKSELLDKKLKSGEWEIINGELYEIK